MVDLGLVLLYSQSSENKNEQYTHYSRTNEERKKFSCYSIVMEQAFILDQKLFTGSEFKVANPLFFGVGWGWWGRK